jgi:hypothetical protein
LRIPHNSYGSPSNSVTTTLRLPPRASSGTTPLKKCSNSSWFARTCRFTSVDRPPTWGKLKITTSKPFPDREGELGAGDAAGEEGGVDAVGEEDRCAMGAVGQVLRGSPTMRPGRVTSTP